MANLNITLKCLPGSLCNTGVSGVCCSGIHPQCLPECGVLQCSHHSTGHSQWPLQCVQRHHADCHTALPQHLHQTPKQKYRYWKEHIMYCYWSSAGTRIQLSHGANLVIQGLFFSCAAYDKVWVKICENRAYTRYLRSSRVFLIVCSLFCIKRGITWTTWTRVPKTLSADYWSVMFLPQGPNTPPTTWHWTAMGLNSQSNFQERRPIER